MKQKVVLKITGRVQGVFYRLNTQEKAKELNLKGFVKNENNGTVKIIAEGEKDNLEGLINWCYQGSPKATVREITTNWEKYKGDFNSFKIKY